MMNFWTSLQETIVGIIFYYFILKIINLDFNKLGSLGLQIQGYFQKVEKNWRALQKVNTYSLKSYSLYGKFKNDIFDDKMAKYAVMNK